MSKSLANKQDKAVRRNRLAKRAGVILATLGLVGGGIAYGVSSTQSAGYSDQQKLVRQDAAWTGAGTGWTDVPGLSTSVTVASGTSRVLSADLTAESLCNGTSTGSSPSYCSVRITYQKVGGSLTEMLPAAGTDFAFDAPSAYTSKDWESHAVNRSTYRLSAGTYTVKVQAARVSGATSFRLDDAHLTVRTSV